MHFCVSAARPGVYGHFTRPRKIGTNWFMPAFVKSRFGECGIRLELATTVCCFDLKKSRNDWRICAEVGTDMTGCLRAKKACFARARKRQIGRASCGERGEISVGAVS